MADPRVRDAVEELGGDATWYRDHYVWPLTTLLVGALRTGDRVYEDVYLDERRRFGFTVDNEGTRAWLQGLLAADTREVGELLDGDRAAAHAALDHLHRPLLTPAPGAPVRLLLVGDCLMTEARAALLPRARTAGIDLHVTHSYISAGEGAALSPEQLHSHIAEHGADLIALSFLTFEGVPPYRALLQDADAWRRVPVEERVESLVAVIRGYLEGLREITAAPFLLHGACGLPLEYRRLRLRFLSPFSRGRRRALALLNQRLRELAQHTENTLFVDEGELVARDGHREATAQLFPADVTSGGLFHTSRFGVHVADAYVAFLEAYARLAKVKVLLVDFDNTLWRGVMAEGTVEHDHPAQLLLKELKEAGLVLVAVSKNDPASIRWDEMTLDRDDFVLHKVSWNHKVSSIEETVGQLDLGLDSCVLIDDNPAERALVEEALSQVGTLDPADPATWRALRWMLDFPNTRRTREAARRTEMYREAAARREAAAGAHDFAALMRTLELRAHFRPAAGDDLERAHELVLRTNQFNTTTKRHSPAEIAALAAGDGGQLYVCTLGDRFGDLGIVGAVVTARDGDDLVFDAVIMSCRAMGFGLERVLLRATMEAGSDWHRAVGLYVPTARNQPSADLFSAAGFAADGEGRWVLAADDPWPEMPPWLDVRTG